MRVFRGKKISRPACPLRLCCCNINSSLKMISSHVKNLKNNTPAFLNLNSFKSGIN